MYKRENVYQIKTIEILAELLKKTVARTVYELILSSSTAPLVTRWEYSLFPGTEMKQVVHENS